MKRTWTKEEILSLLETNDKVLYGALKRLYACQTASEMANRGTVEKNGMGFNAIDGPILSSFAEFLLERGYLSPKQKEIARRKLPKYARQLVILANE